MSSQRSIRVVIVHASRLFREGLVFALSRQRAISVVANVARIDEALDEIASLRPDVYIIDLGTPGRRGLDDVRALRSRHRESKILVIGLGELESDVLACGEAGAGGFLTEEASLADLAGNVRRVVRRGDLLAQDHQGWVASR